jgi:enamine deaminase RidA (YjgF/YER057c/UK114 family)
LNVASRLAALEPTPPAWVLDLFRTNGNATEPEREGRLIVQQRHPFVRVTARISNARLLDGDGLSRAVAERYAAIEALLSQKRQRPIRFWNYVPGIVEPLAPAIDRYMAFNRGRHAAYVSSWGMGGRFERAVPTASAVGIGGPDLVIDCVASEYGGTPIENPRQIASWRYSPRFGPKPPCFARGTLTALDDRRVLLLAGTASVVGEESRHPGNTQAQAAEALRNIEALILHAGCAEAQPLHRLTDVRVYVAAAVDIDVVASELRAACASSLRLEAAVAQVCRPELLVEIEGVALMP